MSFGSGHTFSARYFFFEEDFLPGTFAPPLRASDNPIAIACFLLVTFLPERPLLSVPLLRSCIARSTFSDAFLPYLAISLLYRCSGEILQAYSRPRLNLHATNHFPVLSIWFLFWERLFEFRQSPRRGNPLVTFHPSSEFLY